MFMSLKRTLFKLHKILGLATALVVFIVAITGCCWAFRNEIESLYEDYKKVKPQDAPILTPGKAKALAQQIFPDNTVHGTVFKKADDAIEVIFYDAQPEFYQSVFLNPYSGELIRVKNHMKGFFAFALKGHTRLWLPKSIGKQLVGISVLLFIPILISGFVLWMPRKRQKLKRSLRFYWKKHTGWRRKNFDFHRIAGFYVGLPALILAITGVMLSYDWMKYLVYKSAGGEAIPSFVVPENKTAFLPDDSIEAMDFLMVKLQKENPEADAFELHYPKTKEESIYVEVSNSKGLYYNADYRFFDQHTLEELDTSGTYGKYEDADFADKTLRMAYDLHTGAIGGIAGKIVAFLASLLIATLSVSGMLMWYGRRFKRP